MRAGESARKVEVMYLVANGVMCVEKDSFTFDSGDTVYRAKCTNGQGGILEVEMPYKNWEELTVLDKKYDMEIDVYSRGYKLYNSLVAIAEV